MKGNAANLVAAVVNFKMNCQYFPTIKKIQKMKFIIEPTRQEEDKSKRPYCTTTFESSEGQVQNSYACWQGRFTSSQMWNVLKQKRQFPKKG